MLTAVLAVAVITLMSLIILTSIPRPGRALVMMVNTFVNLFVRVKCIQIKKGKVCGSVYGMCVCVGSRVLSQ